MKRTRNELSQLIRVALFSGLALMMLTLPSAEGLGGNGLVAPVHAAVAPATVTVDCGAGGILQTAINAAQPGDTILVLGTCNESIRFNDEKTRITLDGQGSATIHGPNPASNTILVRGRGITIRGFTITGGRNGIAVLAGGTVLVDGNTIQESSDNGINVAQHSYARIVNSTIQLHPSAGIRVLENSSARIGFLDLESPASGGNVIRSNGAAGVLVQRSAGASLVGNTISENNGPGVSVMAGSHVDLAGNHLNGNTSDGVTVTENSDVLLGGGSGILNPPNATEVPNGGYGVRCSLNSSASGLLNTLTGGLGKKNFDRSCTNGLEDSPGRRGHGGTLE